MNGITSAIILSPGNNSGTPEINNDVQDSTNTSSSAPLNIPIPDSPKQTYFIFSGRANLQTTDDHLTKNSIPPSSIQNKLIDQAKENVLNPTKSDEVNTADEILIEEVDTNEETNEILMFTFDGLPDDTTDGTLTIKDLREKGYTLNNSSNDIQQEAKDNSTDNNDSTTISESLIKNNSSNGEILLLNKI